MKKRQQARIPELTVRVNFLAEAVKKGLQNKEKLELKQQSPWLISLYVGKRALRHDINLPAPVVGSAAQLQVERESSYVEVLLPVVTGVDRESPSLMYPMFLDNGRLTTWNMPYMRIDNLPLLDRKKLHQLLWSNPHASLTYSGRERRIKDEEGDSP